MVVEWGWVWVSFKDKTINLMFWSILIIRVNILNLSYSLTKQDIKKLYNKAINFNKLKFDKTL
jgi:hypothetical protein